MQTGYQFTKDWIYPPCLKSLQILKLFTSDYVKDQSKLVIQQPVTFDDDKGYVPTPEEIKNEINKSGYKNVYQPSRGEQFELPWIWAKPLDIENREQVN